jgi:murein DD-endopeptidase MepM/ murein hydrolase activator NlpD
MNFQRFLTQLIVPVIFFGFYPNMQAQNSDYLPKNVSLSFNGTFQTPKSNGVRNSSENAKFTVKYDIGAVSDGMRELRNLQLFKEDQLVYRLTEVPGSDIYISNSGMLAVIDMRFHYQQRIDINFYNSDGNMIMRQSYRYASLFGFSPKGDKFVVGTDKNLHIIDLALNSVISIESCSKFVFSEDEMLLATAREDEVCIYENYLKIAQITAGFTYPRGITISHNNSNISIIDKKNLKVYSISDLEMIFSASLPENYSFRDIRTGNDDVILTGVHYRHNGVSKGILNVYDLQGELIEQKEIAQKNFKTFEKSEIEKKQGKLYNPIPWPFEPFNEVHKVWNHYEQHMGDGSGDWSYLHQGLDIEVPIDEPTYAVEEGFVKLVLTFGGDYYWRVAVSPEQVPGYSNGWLYAHLVESSIQVDVGDTVYVHDYLGDIIYWAEDWGHIHFVNIRDHGTVWYYDDDEWGINFNPLLALDPITDEVPPQIENFYSGSKFGFCINETSNYLSPDNLHGNVDIIVKISDYHGSSEWEQPAFKTYFWLNKLPGNTNVFSKTLGQILNHSYTNYSTGFFQSYAPLIYKKDNAHPSPPWMNEDRDYWQILTNNNGDSIAELQETQLAFPTADYPDGDYRIVVEAWDEYGNMDIDSMIVTFDNFTTQQKDYQSDDKFASSCFPNPAKDIVYIELTLPSKVQSPVTICLYDCSMKEIKRTEVLNPVPGVIKIELSINDLNSGLYFYKIDSGQTISCGRLLIL